MKTVKYIVGLFGVFFGLNFLLATVLSHIYKSVQHGETAGKINSYLNGDTATEVLIMGPSNTKYQINPASFPVKSFNLSHANTTDVFQLCLLSIICQKKKLPKYILLHINPQEYVSYENKIEEENQRIERDIMKFRVYYNQDRLITGLIDSINNSNKIKFLLPIYRYNGQVISILSNYFKSRSLAPPSDGFSGFLPASAQDSLHTVTTFNRTKGKPGLAGVTIAKRTQYLEEIIGLCKENGVNLICFTLPKYIHFQDSIQYNKADTLVNLLLQKKSVRYFDFRKIILDATLRSPQFWKDINHLNEKGALVQSKSFAEYVSLRTDNFK